MQVGILTDLVVKFGQSPQGGQVVILDTFQRPMGIAKAQRWLPYFSALKQPGQSTQPLHLYPSRYEDGESSAEQMDGAVSSGHTRVNSGHVSQEQEGRTASPQQIMTAVTLQTPIYEFIHKVYAETGQCMLDPVAIAPSYWSLEEFQHNLYQQNFSFSRCPLPVDSSEEEAFQDESLQTLSGLLNAHHMAHPQMIQWIVVDECDRYLGAVDFGNIWQVIMPISAASSSQASLASSAGMSSFPNASAPAPAPARVSDSLLLETLDDLPLPIMIQTADGAVVAQNQTWRSHMAELADAEGLWQQIAHSLSAESRSELPPDMGSNSNPQHVTGHMSSNPIVNAAIASSTFYTSTASPQSGAELFSEKSREALSLGRGEDASGAIAPSLKQTLGQSHSNVDSCLCLCSLNNGQERVWQFHRIRMHSTTHKAEHRMASAFSEAAQAQDAQLGEADAPFQLAPLVSHEARLHPIHHSHDGQPLWLIHVQDMTEQRQVLKELAARNADLAQASQLKDEFLACITHELKTPLTSILGLSGLMKDQSVGSLNSRQQRYMKLIHYSGRRLVGIVNDILDLTRIETGQIQLNSAPTQILRVCEHAYKEARQTHLYSHDTEHSQNSDLASSDGTQSDLEDSGILPAFHLEIQSGLKQVIADELRLRQILSHLISNALKFTPAEGKTGLRVSLWDNWITFTVWDTGIGIPTDKQHLIFQKFQQLENPMTRKFEGTGLGLVLAQKLAQLHGGDLTFTSTEEEGSQFTLLLPPRPLQPEEAWAMNSAASPMLAAAASPSGDRSEVLHSPVNRLIVIVEADRQWIDHLVTQVTSLGFRAVIARSGTEAIGKIRRLQPRIVLLNSVLPMLSGWDVLTLLKADALTRHIPIVVMASPLESAKAKENNAEGLLTHPIHPKEIQRVLNQVSKPSEVEASLDSLTVLYLNPGLPVSSSTQSGSPETTSPDYLALPDPRAIALDTQALNTLLHPYRCRVIEVDDLDQAELLSRVWKPDVVLLGEPFPQPEKMLASLSQRLSLADLPIVTLSRETTQSANQAKRLKVFPCLDPMQVPTEADPAYAFGMSSLLQVIQIATGIQWVPHIVVTHSDYLLHPDIAQVYDPEFKGHPAVNRRLQASSQYFQTAGLRSSVVSELSDITQRVAKKNVDVLLLCCKASQSSLDSLLLKLEMLVRLDPLMPVLIWLDGQSEAKSGIWSDQSEKAYSEPSYLEAALKAWASDVLPATAAVNDVFIAVNAAIARRIHSRSS